MSESLFPLLPIALPLITIEDVYRILGSDGQEYGPVDEDGVRQWILEGRATAKTVLMREGKFDWAPLSTFPEVAPALGAASRLSSQSTHNPKGHGASTTTQTDHIRGNQKRLPKDLRDLGDPIAMQTGWTPAKSGGTSIRTHTLVNINSNRLKFRASAGDVFLHILFILVGLGLLLAFVACALSFEVNLFGENFYIWLLLIGGLSMPAAGWVALDDLTTPVVFDKSNGYFWWGRKEPNDVIDEKTREQFYSIVELEKIHALQLIPEKIYEDNKSYYSYELNLVLKDGNRINVVDHGKLNKLQQDANTIRNFLKKPVWDATDADEDA